MIFILCVVFAASFVGATFGFGVALVGVPLLCLQLPIATATPLAVLVAIAIGACIIALDWRHMHVRSATWLLLPTAAGIPLGLALLASPRQNLVKAALGLLILAYASYCLLGRQPPEVSERRRWMLGSGFLAGILGAAFGMNGPPVVIYGAMRRWPPRKFRATLQAYFLPANAIAAAGYAFSGFWTKTVTHDFLVCLPAVLVATALGAWTHGRIHSAAFVKLVYLALLAIGALLLFQAVHHRP
jgi:uncharacterized membrane protein YfcA